MTKYHLYNPFYSLLLAFILFTSCYGQLTEPLSTNMNLPKKTVTFPKVRGLFKDAAAGCAIQDKGGNLWFGTNGEGLFRYDGKVFTNFTLKEGLDNLIVYSLLQDNAGNIWVGTKSGLALYDGDTFTMMYFDADYSPDFYHKIPVKRTQSPENGVWTMMQDKKGIIWFGTDNGVFCFNGKKFTCFPNSDIINRDSLHLKAIFSFLEDQKGTIWFGSCIGEGIIRFDGKTISRVSPEGYARTQYLTEDKSGNIWFGSIGKGMCRYDGKTISTNVFAEKDTHDLLYLIWKDHADRLWFCETFKNRPLHYYDGNENISFAGKTGIPDNKMYPLVEDKDGNIWFAASAMGLYRYDGKKLITFSE